MCDTKIGRPKKIAGNLSDPKNSGNFAKPRKIAKIICQLHGLPCFLGRCLAVWALGDGLGWAFEAEALL